MQWFMNLSELSPPKRLFQPNTLYVQVQISCRVTTCLGKPLFSGCTGCAVVDLYCQIVLLVASTLVIAVCSLDVSPCVLAMLLCFLLVALCLVWFGSLLFFPAPPSDSQRPKRFLPWAVSDAQQKTLHFSVGFACFFSITWFACFLHFLHVGGPTVGTWTCPKQKTSFCEEEAPTTETTRVDLRRLLSKRRTS